MSVWYRVMCDRHKPPTPVCDIKCDGDDVAVYPHPAVKVPGLQDKTPLNDRVRARIDAMRKGEPQPRFHDGLIRTSNPDVARGESFWITCELCSQVGGKKLSARVRPQTLAWVLARIGSELDTIDTIDRVTVRLLPLHRLCDELRNNPHGGSFGK